MTNTAILLLIHLIPLFMKRFDKHKDNATYYIKYKWINKDLQGALSDIEIYVAYMLNFEPF